MESLQDEIREIRKELRLAMNGVISTSMREKGIVYKLNFGVPYPEIKGIARKHKPNGELAAALWKEDIREFKILATFLQPAETLPLDEAKRWVKEIPYLEIAEHCCRNLFVHLPYMEDFTSDLVADKKNEFARTVAFLTWAENFKRGGSLSSVVLGSFLAETLSSLAETKDFKSTLKEKQASIQAIHYIFIVFRFISLAVRKQSQFHQLWICQIIQAKQIRTGFLQCRAIGFQRIRVRIFQQFTGTMSQTLM